jgi:hypothetical protein
MYLLLAQVGLSALAGVVAAFLTAQFALRRFYREKWWEAKMKSYTGLIDALHHMKRDLEISMKAIEEGRDTETEYYKASEAKNREAWAEMRRSIDVGDFLLSKEAMGVLQQFFRASAAADNPNLMYWEHMDYLLVAVQECLPAIKAAGRADLGLPAIPKLQGQEKSN